MSTTVLTVLVLAKAPRPGYSKTRLIPAFGPDGASQLAGAALTDTVDAVRAADATARVLVLDGLVEDLPDTVSLAGFRVVPQTGGDHAERIIAAFEQVSGPAVLIGMDTPQVTPDLLRLDLGSDADAWLGLAADGGWWILGLRHARRDARRVLSGVPMSTDHTGRDTRDRLVQLGLQVTDVPVLRDVDDGEDALAVAAETPLTRFGMLVSRLTGTAPPGAPGPAVAR